MEENTKRYIMLSLMPGLGTVRQKRLLKLCKGIDDCFRLSPSELISRDYSEGKVDKVGAGVIKTFVGSRDSAEIEYMAQSILKDCAAKGVDIITPESTAYPDRFRGLYDMPIVFYIRGSLKINSFARSIGIVGARRCSASGKNEAIRLTERELENGSSIISGMAKGIDSYAHTAALKNQGYTIAVLGSGPDICYPKEHEKLYEEITEKGCVLSEYPPGSGPRSYMFPRRNRLIAALSDEIHVIDTGKRSGTNTTVEACRAYERAYIMTDPEPIQTSLNM